MPQRISSAAATRMDDLPLGQLIDRAAGLAENGDLDSARRLYQEWIDRNPENSLLYAAHFNCSALHNQAGDTAKAIRSLQSAIALNADFIPAYINLGGILERSGSPQRALELWKTAISRPLPINGQTVAHTTTALKQMARVLSDMQQTEAAESAIQQCLEIDPHQPEVIEQYAALRLAQCKWPVIVPGDRLDRQALLKGVHPLSLSVYTDDPLLQLAGAERYASRTTRDEPLQRHADRSNSLTDTAGRKIRVGYVSSDLRDHAIGYLMAEFFELHGKREFEVFAYYCGPQSSSALTLRIQAAVDHWVDIRTLSDDEAARRIADDGIDILIDVNGHTRDARTGVFARRPAPIQVNWLGYPGTMGTPYHHYVVADDWIVPEGSELYYSEKVLRLPCYQPNDRKRVVATGRPSRGDAGLPVDAFVFCCFNGTHKISQFTFRRWMEILTQVPRSVMWLLDTTPETKERLGDFAERHGVDRSRLVFAPKLKNSDHLARYPLADLFLDTAPYGAHTTASDALWMGVPVVTLAGRGFASRVCGSLVRSAGLDELVVTKAEDYVARAVTLASDPAQLAALKEKLASGRDSCPLFDTALLVRKLEELYRIMVREHNLGRTPQPSLANLDAYLDAGSAFDHDAHEMLSCDNYHEYYKSKLALRHLDRPMQPDGRLWTSMDVAAANGKATIARAPVQVAAQTGPNTTCDVLQDLKRQGYAPGTLLDVGAHVGRFTRSFLDIFPDCVPTLIEPNPFCRDDLSRLGFEHHAVAASDKTDQATLFLTKEWLQSTGTSLYRENTPFFRDDVIVGHDVPTCRIDDLFAGRHFDFVKIDTQGAELDVLRGGETVLRQADYILVEVPLVEYNRGGATAEAIFAQLRAMGFHCAEATEFHRLAGVRDGELLQMDFLFARRSIPATSDFKPYLGEMRMLAESLAAEGRNAEASLLLRFLAIADCGNADILRPLAKLLAAQGRSLEALETLCELKSISTDVQSLVAPIEDAMPSALKSFNESVAAGAVAEAENLVSKMIALIPNNGALLEAALACNLNLGRRTKATEYAARLLALDPAHEVARTTLGMGPRSSLPPQAVRTPADSQAALHPLVRLRDIHDAVSAILCRPLNAEATERVGAYLNEARELIIPIPADSDWQGWEKHYRVMLDAIDLAAVAAPTPPRGRDQATKLIASKGEPVTWQGLRQIADRLGAKAVFFAAADRAYIDLYARHYIQSILEHSDVPCIVIVHVIGGKSLLADINDAIGVPDERVFFTGDGFEAERITTKCYDAPPKGQIGKPVAHLQSVRFLRLGSLLDKLKLPTFVSDIDLILQSGVADLLARFEGKDLVLNLNDASEQAGARFTANLLLVNPTENAAIFARFMRHFLERELAKPEVTRWIDQLGLLLGQHHLLLSGHEPQIGHFDTSRDINNLMYRTYAQNPFTFFSLYHGFDMSSLKGRAKIADGPVATVPGALPARRPRKIATRRKAAGA